MGDAASPRHAAALAPLPALSYWRVVPAPAWPRVVGQGAMPSGPVATVTAPDGSQHELTLTWGQLVRASSSCDPDRGVARLDAEPVALARCAVVRQLRNAGVVEPVGG
jgi:hypothetical protein